MSHFKPSLAWQKPSGRDKLNTARLLAKGPHMDQPQTPKQADKKPGERVPPIRPH